LANKSFTLIVVPDHDSKVRRLHVEKRWLRWAIWGAGGFACVLLAGMVHYLFLAKEASKSRALRRENVALRSQLKAIGARVEHIHSTLDRVERFDRALRELTLFSDPQRNLAMGPTEDPQGQPGRPPLGGPNSADSPHAVASRLDKLSHEADRQEQSLLDLQSYFQDQRVLLASIPSIWPARGWVTSDFSERMDPYTAERVMHQGLDIAAAHGKEVLAPSDGTVLFSGLEGSYGNVLVLDHGYGIKTRYGHLAQLLVKSGEKVARGQQVATVGNTGRSTGPHLHYEVRVNGIPQNPRKFILED